MEINYIAAFLTLSCQLKCHYCINHHGHDLYTRKQMSADDWVKGLNRIPYRDDIPITLQGGEPTLHKEFYEIINGINNHPIDLLTNLECDIHEFMKNISPQRMKRTSLYASIRVSWHIGQNSGDHLLDKVQEMTRKGYSIGIWAIAEPDCADKIFQAKTKAKAMGIDFRIKEFLGKKDGNHHGTLKYPDAVNGIPRSCQCRTSELLIDPQGKVFRCHSDLYANRYPIGSMFDEQIPKVGVWRDCTVYGLCNSCDVKIKTNRFQEYGHSSVEIVGIK